MYHIQPKAQVWNDGTEDYSEDFKGKLITIKAKDYYLMDSQDASEFMAQYVSPKKDGGGNFTNSKPLRKVILATDEAEDTKSKLPDGYCIVCNRDFGMKAGLAKHIREKHSNLLRVDKEKSNDSINAGNPSKE